MHTNSSIFLVPCAKTPADRPYNNPHQRVKAWAEDLGIKKWLLEPARARRNVACLFIGAAACFAASLALLAAARILPAALGDAQPPGWLISALRGLETGIAAAAIIAWLAAAVSIAVLAAVFIRRRRRVRGQKDRPD